METKEELHKQLKRLEQENEELRQVRKDLPDIQSPYVVLYRQIKAENEKLKKQLEIDKNQINYFIEENEKLKQQIDQWKSAFSLDTKMLEHTENAEEKYQQALEEIREINKWFFDMNYGFDEQGISEDVKNIAHEIQDKINEVLK